MTSEAGAPAAPARLARAATLDFLLAISLLVAASVVIILPIVLVGLATAPDGLADRAAMDARMQSLEPMIVLGAVLGMAVAAIGTWWLRGRGLSAPIPAMPRRKALLLALPAGVAIQLFALSMGVAIAGLGADIEPSNAAPLLAMADTHPWLMAGLVVLAAPFAEELLFRHVLLRRFALHGRPVLGLLATSLLFSALHEPWPGEAGVAAWLATVLLYVGMGVGFGLVYLRTGRLDAAMLAHATCNAVALLPMLASPA